MFAFWLLLSGHLEVWLVVSGAVCAIAVSAVAYAMGVADREGHPVGLLVRATVYWPWLGWEIVKSAIGVTRLILDPRLPITPVLVRFKTRQRTAVGLAVYANSITLTPGTISALVSSHDREILVHAISRDAAKDLARGGMDARVAWFERGPA